MFVTDALLPRSLMHEGPLVLGDDTAQKGEHCFVCVQDRFKIRPKHRLGEVPLARVIALMVLQEISEPRGKPRPLDPMVFPYATCGDDIARETGPG